ncbi:hypothetical protein RF11_00998 [Thelohanellus kitauei]|uniref:Uncharacterized protein n=1 Tax=Thelohanellus kitauei TaxID=669202 RepID=A0A0C2IBM8_THEKT|nr:hypothetical protein RF11_00998 [Thelohanellus kitauei]
MNISVDKIFGIIQGDAFKPPGQFIHRYGLINNLIRLQISKLVASAVNNIGIKFHKRTIPRAPDMMLVVKKVTYIGIFEIVHVVNKVKYPGTLEILWLQNRSF